MTDPLRSRFVRPGRCCLCGRHRPVATAQRFGGGNYRRGGRWYRTSVCEQCATEAVDHADGCSTDPRKVYGLALRGLRDLTGRPRPAPSP